MSPSSPPPGDRRFDLIVLAGSAGGAAAAVRVLRSLLSDLAVPVVLMLHLPPGSDLIDYLARLPYIGGRARWLEAGARLEPGRVLACPPRAFVELLPDGSCRVSANDAGALDMPIDRLLQSVALSFGPRAIAVVLSGMANDGAAGARALHAAGGQVLVQTPASAEFADMPQAAIDAGAADLVVPLDDLGAVALELMAGTPRPRARSELQALARAFGDRGEVAGLARELDWAATPLGPVLMWPAELRVLVRTVMDSPNAAAVWWGPQLVQVYNDAWRPYLGATRHPRALGGPARETWAAIWPAVEPAVQRVLARGEAVGSEEALVFIERHDLVEEAYLSFSYAPLLNAGGDVAGVLHTVRDQTYGVLTERRMRALQAVATQAMGAATAREVCERAAAALADFSADLPFALFYLLDGREHHATLAAVTGLAAGSPAAPHVVHLVAEDAGGWPLLKAWFETPTAGPGPWLVDDLPRRFARLAVPAHAAAGTQPPERAVVLPLRSTAGHKPTGALVLALSPHRPLDARYRGFVDFVAQQVNAALGEALARQLERERMQRLAELDRAKSEFFSNISHEFRTPLTLLLAPLERFRAERDRLPPGLAEDVDAAARNARRLVRLVDNLLDFSRGDGQRPALVIEPTALDELTEDIASAFRSAIEAAGLSLRLDIEAGMPPVPVDRELWEGVVSNLLSNAFKFTFEGGIRVALRRLRLHVELEVTDTGVGIPQAELPHVFKRFHRVSGTRARTVEGSGVGLALVQDSVQLMGGQVSVHSVPGGGTSFQVWLPLKSLRRSEGGEAGRPAAARPGLAHQLASEAGRWTEDASGELPDEVVQELVDVAAPPPDGRPRQRVLVVDDNADIRAYLRRLLGQRWEVVLAADGAQALALAREAPPDAVLADVMMPGLDGFGLLKALRADAATQRTPLLMLTARAGERAAIEGLQAGADDFIAKPFSPRELLARLQATLGRAQAEAALRESEAHLARELEDARVLQDISNQLVSEGGPEGHYARIVAAARTLMRSDAASLQELDAAHARLKLLAHSGFQPESAAFWACVDAGVGSSCGRALAAGKRVVVPDMDAFDADADDVGAYRQSALMSVQSTPLVASSGRIVGMMSTHWKRPHTPGAASYRFFDVLARLAADFMERARAEAALRESEERYRSLFETLGRGDSERRTG